MNLPHPSSSKEYPFYLLGYIIFFFLITFLFSTLSILGRISDDGLYVNYYPCLIEGTDDFGRPTCEQSSNIPNNQVPVGSWLINQSKTDLILVMVVGIPLGLYGWSQFDKKLKVKSDDY